MTPAPERYAVIGHPVAHSLSPWIHAQFAQQTARSLIYSTIDAPSSGAVTITIQPEYWP